MMNEVRRTTPADLIPVAMTMAKVIGGVAVLGTGNLLLAGGMYWMYKRSQQPAPAEVAKKA
jgi:hypothetical protein